MLSGGKGTRFTSLTCNQMTVFIRCHLFIIKALSRLCRSKIAQVKVINAMKTKVPINARMPWGWRFPFLLLLITLAGAAPRLAGITEEMTYDEAHYAEAARLGVAANALDRWNSFELRHLHPPLLAYLMRTSLQLFGESEWAIRLPSILASLLLIPLVGALLTRLTGDGRAGLFGALLLVAMPANTVSARVGDHHSLVTLFLVPAVSFLGIAIAESSAAALILSGLSLGLLVAVSEFGAVVAGACLLLLVLLPNSFLSLLRRPRRVSRSLLGAIGVALFVPIPQGSSVSTFCGASTSIFPRRVGRARPRSP